jgi:hypothetical protein
VVEVLSSKHKTLSLNSRTAKKSGLGLRFNCQLLGRCPYKSTLCRYVDQCRRIEDKETTYTPTVTLFLTKAPKIYIGEKTASSTNGVGKTGYSHAED